MQGRGFNQPDDFRKLQVFLAEMRSKVSQAAYFHYGDLLWRINHPLNLTNIETGIRIWEDAEGRICGFTFWTGADEVDFFTRPKLYESPIGEKMLSWALAEAKKKQVQSIRSNCVDREVEKRRFLERLGFVRSGNMQVFLERPLADPLPRYRLPSEYSIISIADHPELTSGNGLSIYPPEVNKRIRSAPGYKSDLDVKACYCNEEVTSGCICWYDDVGNCAVFEPVGTRDDHRGKGLALAVMAQAMENLKRYGAKMVYVGTGKNNTPTVHLYQKAGFSIIDEIHEWQREM